MTEPREPRAERPIPHPAGKPIIGNLMDLGSESQVQDLMKLAAEFGEIFALQIAGRRTVVVSGFELVDELCDESRFDKRVWAPLKNLRAFAGDGLFTAHTFEPNWKRAHDILLPAFGVSAMKGYHPMMLDVAYQMVERWERLNQGETVDVSDQMTRLTLDTIGLCGFDYRFNSFYRERMHPFVRAMTRAMAIALDRSLRPEFSQRLLFRENKRFRRAVAMMNETVDGIIQERRAAGEDPARKDLLACMLAGRDRETGEPLDDLNIRYQILTFLIAGHETTSGLLSFALYFLVERPDVLERATEEVDRVFGDDPASPPGFRQVTELRYVRQVLNESLRLWPTAPAFSLYPKEGSTLLGGRYRIDKRDALIVLTPMLHRDRSVWGDNGETFDPDRFSPERERERPANAFKPFGNGQRACIGRQFALHEATLALGLILQRFRPVDHAGYQLRVKETLTLKPEGFFLRVEPRSRRRLPVRTRAERPAAAEAPVAATAPTAGPAPGAERPHHGTPLLVLYGSNMGTAEGVAQRVADQGRARGFAVEAAPMDEYAGRLPGEGALIVVTSSYNGTPPDNAVRFCDWLRRTGDGDALAGLRFAVFGCGNRDWAATYQQVPKLVDSRLEALGATRVSARGEGDASDDFDGDLERWDDRVWRDVAAAFELDPGAVQDDGALLAPIEVEVLEERHPNPFVVSFAAQPMVIVENRELQATGSERSTRHIELSLPPGVSYETGDHLGVIPRHDDALVQRVLDRFGLDEDARVRIMRRGSGRTELPLDVPIRASRLLAEYVELQDPATRAQIKVLAEHTGCPPDRARLLALSGDDDGRARYRAEVLEPRRSLLDLLEEHAACELPFGAFLGLLPPLRPRYYSISSSPRALDRIVSITVGVVEGPARSGHGVYRGVCSCYLRGRRRGEQVHAFVRDTRSSFRLPKSARTPLILVGPGTGIAPFRGFLQERADQNARGAEVGPALLFFGCRHRQVDFLYREELEALQEQGVLELYAAFSRDQPHKRYVQHQLLEQADRVWELLEQGAVVYVCGDAAHMAPDVRAAFAALHRQRTGGDAEAAERWLAGLQEARRYLVDVWA
jgi:cytochrome P450 / NADPH-cytochrome P450 reductase